MANSVLAPSCTKVRAVFVSRPTGGMDLPGRAETRRTVVTPGTDHRAWNESGGIQDRSELHRGQSPHEEHVLQSSDYPRVRGEAKQRDRPSIYVRVVFDSRQLNRQY